MEQQQVLYTYTQQVEVPDTYPVKALYLPTFPFSPDALLLTATIIAAVVVLKEKKA